MKNGHRWYAAAYDFVTRVVERQLGRRIRPLAAGAATGRVLEIGAGTGLNLRYYGAAESVIATDPDAYMLRQARKRAEASGITVEFCLCPAETLPFTAASFDTVVSTLTRCTVRDPVRVLTEVRRVLEPNGVFRFIEHVRTEGGFHGWVQDRLTPVWRRVGAGCHLNRRTLAAIEASGFEITELQRRPLPLTPLVIGTARLKT